MKNPVEVRTIAFNFDQEATAYAALEEQLKDIEIGILGMLRCDSWCGKRDL